MSNRKIWLIADTHFGYKGDDEEWLDDYIGYFENIVVPLMKAEVGEDDILIKLTGEDRVDVVNTLYRGVLDGVTGTAYTLIRVASLGEPDILFVPVQEDTGQEENLDEY